MPRSSVGGIRIASERRSTAGDPTHLLLSHATGFCKEIWRPVVAEIDARRSVGSITSFDQRAHGDSGAPPRPFSWDDLASDALAVVADLDGPIVGVGHSSGAALLVLAEQAHPGRFAGLVLIEPIIFPPPHRRFEDSPLAAATLRRRYRFRTREDARLNYEGKGPFALWRTDALDAYLAGGLRQEGDGFVLKCDPADEAEFYRTGAMHRAWEGLPEVSPPIILLAGADSDTHPEPFLEALASRMGDPEVEVVPGATHFLPMERPDVVADTVVRLLEAVRSV
jgi:pimeloyl-ACP methyl ester carboxylesterase